MVTMLSCSEARVPLVSQCWVDGIPTLHDCKPSAAHLTKEIHTDFIVEAPKGFSQQHHMRAPAHLFVQVATAWELCV